MASQPTQDQLNDIAYESDLNADGTIASPGFLDWVSNTAPAQYDPTNDFTRKWDNDANGVTAGTSSVAGTGGGTVTYSFGAGVTAAQQTAFASTLTLWSDEANITFKAAATGATADLVFNVTSSGPTNNQLPQASSFATVGSNQIPSDLDPSQPGGSQDIITFDNGGGYGTIGSFTDSGGYGESALTHEVGHMLGLGHSGPYNDGPGAVNPPTSQYNEYDDRQWSVMSYIDPTDTTATYYNQYPTPGTNYNSVTTTTTTNPDGSMTIRSTTQPVAPETPMIDDIVAVQRIYGAATTGALTQAQTFGFNCTVNDASKPFFDFTQNVNPVITLYDSSTSGSTLDCSGFSTNCTINLNPGTFSTANATTLVNNIGIAYGTKIDTAIGGSGNDTFTVNADNDTINGGAGMNTAVFSGARAAYTVVTTPGTTNTIVTSSGGVVDTLSNIESLKFSDQTDSVCFTAGTLIRTVRGDVAVESLVVGDLAVTASGAHRPICWLGHRVVDCTTHAVARSVWPIRIAAHAFGEGQPERDLSVSPGHAVCVDVDGGILIPAGSLINGATVTQVPVASVTYWHVELESHDILLANGLPAESYLDCGNRHWFAGGIGMIDPDRTMGVPAGFCRPFIPAGPGVETCRARLEAQAEALGWRQTHDMEVNCIAGGQKIEPLVEGGLACFLLPKGAETVDLVSATFAPSWWAGSDDRRLGIHVSGLRVLDGFGREAALALDDPSFAVGFHPEVGDATVPRWTTGRLTLHAHLWAHCKGAVFLQVRFSADAARRWIGPGIEPASNVVTLQVA